MSITYRTAAPSDAAALLDYLKTVGGETDNLTFGAAGIPLTVEQEEAMLARRENSAHSRFFLALDGEKIVGYAFGHAYEKEKKTDTIPVGSRCFDVDELYVLPAYRSRGVGGRLFQAVEAYAKTQGDFLTLATSTKDYKRVLHFYAEQNGMDFHDAYLTKKL